MLTAPEFLFVQVNKRCNLRCQHCDFWKQNDDDRANYMPWKLKRGVLREFADMRPNGKVVICGGESMLDLEDYFAISRTCREFGLKALSVINGTRVRDVERADRMIEEGPHEISVSLNSHRPELHDRTRGIKGAFDKAVKALRLMIEARARHPGSDTRIYAMGLVFDENHRELESFYDFVLNDVGADKLKLNFLQPSFGQLDPEDRFFANHHNVDPDVVAEQIDQCDRRFGLGLNPVWREQVRMYFRSLHHGMDLERGWASSARTEEHICNTYERNIMLDHYGVARLCFSTIFPGMEIRAPGDLRRFWASAEPIRREMSKCNRFCGISHSVRRETSTLASRRPTVPVRISPASAARLVDLTYTFKMR
ncbi:MAG: radical SAM protein [Casimicrobiaceae bacterium]